MSNRIFEEFDDSWPHPVYLIRQHSEGGYGAGGYTKSTQPPTLIDGHFAPFYRVEEEGFTTGNRFIGVSEEGEMSFFTYYTNIQRGDIIEQWHDDAGNDKTKFQVIGIKRTQVLMTKYLGQDERIEAYLREMVDEG